MKRKNSL